MSVKLKTLVLKKDVISVLDAKVQSELKGGTLLTVGLTILLTVNYSLEQCKDLTNTSNGKDCDIHTIGHDDGTICVSKKVEICRGRP